MIYPDVTYEEWAFRYNIENSSKPCLKCGKILFPVVPFAYKDWRGLKSSPHSCGEQYDLVYVISVDKNKRERWIKVYKDVNALF